MNGRTFCVLVTVIGLMLSSCKVDPISVSISVTGKKLPGEYLFVDSNVSDSEGQPIFTWKVNGEQRQLGSYTSGFGLYLPFDGLWKIDLTVKDSKNEVNDSYDLVIENPNTLDYTMGKKLLGKWYIVSIADDNLSFRLLDYDFTFMFSTSSGGWSVALQKDRGIFNTIDGLASYHTDTESYSILDRKSVNGYDLFYSFDVISNNKIYGHYW